MESQALRESFLEMLGGKPHQKFLKLLSRIEHKLVGNKKELMAYEGIVAATDFRRTNLFAWERVLALQPSILPRTLLRMNWKAPLLELPIGIGRPR
jgi:hypothetical protein